MGISTLLKNPQAREDMAEFGDAAEDVEHALPYLSYSHGLMTAVIIGPRFISSSEWLPLIVDQSSSPVELDVRLSVMELILLEHDKILETLKADEKVYEPFFWRDDNQHVVTRDWAEGFLAGVRLREYAWAPLLDGSDPYARTLLYVLYQEDEFCAKLAESERDLDEAWDSIRNETANFVQMLYHRWDDRRSADLQSPSRRVHKAGRNDTCPCGSGLKYKKCCLH